MSEKNRIISGTFWTTASTLTTAIVQILRLSILAHFLEKGDFGVVAILTLVLGLTYTFSDLGFSSAIIHKKDITREEFCSLYWVQMFIYVVIYFAGILCSGWVADYFSTQDVQKLLPITLLDLILHGVGRLYDTLLQKNFQFRILALRNIFASIISLILAVCLAANGYGVYSLIFSTLCQTSLLNLWNFVAGQKMIRIGIFLSFRKIYGLAKIGLWQTGTQILDYISAKIDILIIGHYLGTDDLGLYNLAKELVMKIVLLINSVANKVALPFFADIQDDNLKMNRAFSQMMKALTFVNFPVCTIIGALSSVVIAILYGEKYMDAVLILAILTIWGMLVCVGNPVGNLAIAKGKTHLLFEYTIVRLLITIPVIYILSRMGLMAISLGLVVVSAIMLVFSWYFQIWKVTQMKLRMFIRSFERPFLISTILGSLGFVIVQNNFMSIQSPWWQLIIYGIPISIIYIFTLFIIERNDLIALAQMFTKKH